MQVIILDATTKKLQLVLGEAATTELDYTASWADSTATDVTEGNSNGTSNDTTPVDIVAAPAASTRRIIKDISVYNNDNISHTLTINYNDNGTLRKIWSGTITSGAIWYLSRVLSAGGGSPLTTKGDIYVYGAINTRLGIGTDTYALVADSAEATGLKWVNLSARSETQTNKRIEPRIVTATSYTTDTGTSLDVSTADIFQITAQAGALLFNAPGGTPVAGQKLIIRIKDNGTARALTWNTVFRAMGTALPSTTILSKTLYLGFIYNITDTKWDLVASAQEA